MPRTSAITWSAGGFRKADSCPPYRGSRRHGTPRGPRYGGRAGLSRFDFVSTWGVMLRVRDRIDTPRRERMEQGEPFHRMDRRPPVREGNRGGPGRGAASETGGLRLRPGLHLRAEAGHQDPVARAGGDGPDVDPHPQLLEAERAALRRAPGPEQGRDRGEVRRRTGPDMAPQLRRSSSPA